MTSAERRQIGYILADYYRGRTDEMERALIRMAGEHAPARPALPPLIVTAEALREAVATGGPQPKPSKRIVSRKALREYRARFALCEVGMCMAEPCPEPHHLVSRKMGGPDEEGNLIALCKRHHMEWHSLGGRTWFQKYRNGLTADCWSKVERALRMGEEG